MARLVREGKSTIKELKKTPEMEGIYKDKIMKNALWAKHLGLFEKNSKNYQISPVGEKLLDLLDIGKREIALEIMYYNVCKNHELIRYIVNTIAYDYLYSLKEITRGETITRLVQYTKTQSEINASEKSIEAIAQKLLDTLALPEGFGSLGICEKMSKGKYRFEKHMPNWRSVAYMLYDWWPKGFSRVRIKDLKEKDNSFGRIFLLNERDILTVLKSYLRPNEIVSIEIAADLNQIAVNPYLNTNKILEKVISDEF
jgi:hypothetical protein